MFSMFAPKRDEQWKQGSAKRPCQNRVEESGHGAKAIVSLLETRAECCAPTKGGIRVLTRGLFDYHDYGNDSCNVRERLNRPRHVVRIPDKVAQRKISTQDGVEHSEVIDEC